jgi:tetratricopeptide (TPR) repeat protein
MRQMVERLRLRVEEFIGQRDDLVLVVRCSESDTALVSKVVEGQDESSTSELYWTMVDDFDDAPSFVDACVRSFATKHNTVRLALQQQKLPAWPPLPVRIADPAGLPPVERLKELIIFIRSLLPTLTGCGVVWALLPMQINDGEAYAAFVRSLWRHEFPFPWCHHVRMMVRDDFDAPILAAEIGVAPRVGEYVVDFSPDAIRQGLEEEAGDDNAPLGDRVNSCLMLAGIDFSHGRYDRAIQQYDIVHQYAASSQNPTLAAVALNGMGDALRALGKVAEADVVMQTALAPAAAAPQPPIPVLFDLYSKLGELRLSQERWPEAEVFLQGAADFALLLHDPNQRLKYLKLLGEAQYRQAKTTPALKTWYAGAIVAGKLRRDDEYRGFVTQLQNHYSAAGAPEDLERVMDHVAREIASHDPDALPAEFVLPAKA